MTKRKDLTVSPGTWARTIVLLLALVNQCLAAAGKPVIPVDDETLSSLITNGFTVAAALIAWWKNNSFTCAALNADEVYKMMKKQV